MTVYSMRLATLVLTVLLAQLDHLTWKSSIFAIGFGHYLVSVWYGRSRLASVASDWRAALPAAAILAIGGGLYWISFSLFLYFSVHHVCNEVFATAEITERLPPDRRLALRTACGVLHFLLYFAILQQDLVNLIVGFGNPTIGGWAARIAPLVPVLPWVAGAVYFALLYRDRAAFDRNALLELSVFEVISLALLALLPVMPIRFFDVICFHVVFWWFLPLRRLAPQGRAAVLRYSALTAVCTVVPFLMSPVFLPAFGSIYAKQFILWSHIHITASFFLSAANPVWIRRWFVPARPATAIAAPSVAAPSVAAPSVA